jgi:hypothetical protein
MPNQSPRQTGHTTHGSARFNVFRRLSRLLCLLFGDKNWR